MPNRPLQGWTVGVTADRRAEEQIELLRRQGASVLHGPAIRMVPLGPGSVVGPMIAELIASPPDLLVLTTGLGIRSLFDAADATGLTDELLGAIDGREVVVRGPKAAGAARAVGLEVTWQACTATSAELLTHLRIQGLGGRRVAVQLDGRAEPVLGDAIRAMGAHVVDVAVYRWTAPDDHEPLNRLLRAACEHRLDAVTFTSSPALANLVACAETEGLADDLRAAFDGPVAAVSVGRVCTETARELGIEPAVEPERHRLGALVRALALHGELRQASGTTSVGGVSVTVRAAAVVVAGEIIDITEREQAVLVLLLERAGSVVSKAFLLQQVWPDGDDPHVVEVTVARLRRRLAGRLLVEAVPRRGYRIIAPLTAT